MQRGIRDAHPAGERDGSGLSLGIGRNAADGTPAAPVRLVALAPQASFFFQSRIARRGPEAIVGWISTQSLGPQLARVAP